MSSNNNRQAIEVALKVATTGDHALLDWAVAVQLSRKNTDNLFAGRGGKLLSKQVAVKTTTDFDLITWLVIKNDQ